MATRALAFTVAAFVAMIGTGMPAARAGVEVGLGVDDRINGRTAGVAMLGYVTEQRYPWEFAVGGFSGRGMLDPLRGDAPTNYFAAISKRLSGEHWFVSGGVACNTVDDWVLSGHLQFLTSAGFRLDRWTLSVRHMSNAGIRGTNHGETFALVEYVF
ncbi:MAG TPA: acyloxyacyl hydrolase [Xanthomonadaceae bacterium]|nr:acyloxyacyl hydrolase [Xanthomonadaceae bacterium]